MIITRLAAALLWETKLGHLERNPATVARSASDLIELCTRQNFAILAARRRDFARLGAELRPVAPRKALVWIEDGIRNYRATGSMLRMPYFLDNKG